MILTFRGKIRPEVTRILFEYTEVRYEKDLQKTLRWKMIEKKNEKTGGLHKNIHITKQAVRMMMSVSRSASISQHIWGVGDSETRAQAGMFVCW